MPSEKQIEALKDVLAHLVAAHSLLSRSPKTAAASDKMFDQMLADYQASIDRGRAALNAAKQAEPAATWVSFHGKCASCSAPIVIESTIPPSARSGAVKVKPLEWRLTLSKGRFLADVPLVGRYIADEFPGAGKPGWLIVGPDDDWRLTDTIEAAKAAAQADYDSRILAALEPAEPATDAEPVAARRWDTTYPGGQWLYFTGPNQQGQKLYTRPPESRLREAAREAVNCLTHHAEDNENTRWVLSLLNDALKEASR